LHSIARALRPNSGNCVGVAYLNEYAVAITTTTVPNDDARPQNTEGGQVMTLNYTPKNANNTLIIEVQLDVSHSVASAFIFASVFKDSDADSLFTCPVGNSTGTLANSGSVLFGMPAGTTNQITFKVRVGSSSAGTLTFNGQVGVRHMGTT